MDRTMPKTKHPLYRMYCHLLAICQPVGSNKKARGEILCTKWRDDFWNFVEDMGPKPDGTTIVRKDIKRIYYPGNCYWGLPIKLIFAKYRDKLIYLNGSTYSKRYFAKVTGLDVRTVTYRRAKGLTGEELAFPAHSRSVYIKFMGIVKSRADWSIISGVKLNKAQFRPGNVEKLLTRNNTGRRCKILDQHRHNRFLAAIERGKRSFSIFARELPEKTRACSSVKQYICDDEPDKCP